MYRIYISSKSDFDDIHYELYDYNETRLIFVAKDKWEFKLKLNLMGINSDTFKIDNYSIFKNLVGSYTALIIMSRRND